MLLLLLQNIKKKFPMVVQRCNEVVSRAAKLGSEASIDVDQLALRVTLDVIGLVRGTQQLFLARYSVYGCYAAQSTTMQLASSC